MLQADAVYFASKRFLFLYRPYYGYLVVTYFLYYC